MTVKPFFSSKSETANTIILHENHRIIKGSKKISHTLNKYFTNVTKILKLKKVSTALKNNPLKHQLQKFKNQSIKKIQKHFNSKEKFTFRKFQQGEIIKIIKVLPKNDASSFKDILVKTMVIGSYILSRSHEHFQ